MRSVALILLGSIQLSFGQFEYGFTNFAGFAGGGQVVDGTGTNAQMGNPVAISADTSGNMYVSDIGNHVIRRVTTNAEVTTLAGTPGVSGTRNGSSPLFYHPIGSAVDNNGSVYVADSGNQEIRQIAPGGSTSTFAGYFLASDLADGTGMNAHFNYPNGIALGPDGNFYVADTANRRIRKMTPDAAVTTIAGGGGQFLEGPALNTRFQSPHALAVDALTNIYVSDYDTVRKMTFTGTNWWVTTMAGKPAKVGSADGPGRGATFKVLSGIAVDALGAVYVADSQNYTIRKLVPAGDQWFVFTIGGAVGQNGSVDGVGSDARFGLPQGVLADSLGNLFIADEGNRIVKGTLRTQTLPLQFLSVSRTATSQLETVLGGPPGSNVVIESSLNLSAWSPRRTNTLSVHGIVLEDFPMAVESSEFFRAHLSP